MVDVVKYPWGSEVIYADTKQYAARMFVVTEGQQTEQLYHKKRDKTIFILQGVVQLTVEGKNRILNAGEKYHLPPKLVHKIVAMQGDAVILEVGTPMEDDIVIVEE